jgi:uncharacterized protein (TIGR00369 family)
VDLCRSHGSAPSLTVEQGRMLKGKAFHPICFACGSSNGSGLRMRFRWGPEGSTCTVAISSRFQSYESVVHGGVIATLLDAAMVHALRGESGGEPLTCRLEVRYLRPVPCGESLTVVAKRAGHRGRVLLAEAELSTSGVCHARARGAFTLR